MMRRVCIQTAEGVLVDAPKIHMLGTWIPVPEGFIALARADALRPTGIHPSLWYERWPRNVDTRDAYTFLTHLGEQTTVFGYSLADALREAGLRKDAVRRFTIQSKWY